MNWKEYELEEERDLHLHPGSAHLVAGKYKQAVLQKFKKEKRKGLRFVLLAGLPCVTAPTMANVKL